MDGKNAKEPTNSTGMHGLRTHLARTGRAKENMEHHCRHSPQTRRLNHGFKVARSLYTAKQTYYNSLYTAWQPCSANTASVHTTSLRLVVKLLTPSPNQGKVKSLEHITASEPNQLALLKNFF